MKPPHTFTTAVVLSLVTAACGAAPDAGDRSAVDARLDAIADHVEAWAAADTLEEATAQAEAAANLVVGPAGPGYGDRNADGVLGGESGVGLLAGLDGTPGLVLESVGSCVDRDVLGGPWDDPAERWQELADALEAWTPANNTMPRLDSHPMRIVGWATLAQSAGIGEVLEYAGHAGLHVEVTRRAIADC
jgi:hypothetical protein